MKLEEIIPEIHTLTTGTYYREFQRLVDHLMTISPSDRIKYRVLCRESIYNECKRICDFFNITLYQSCDLPEKHLMICVNYHKLKKDLGWL